jgi:hypothetical protein
MNWRQYGLALIAANLLLTSLHEPTSHSHCSSKTKWRNLAGNGNASQFEFWPKCLTGIVLQVKKQSATIGYGQVKKYTGQT